MVLIESGSRHLLEDLIPGLYEIYGQNLQLDLVTCYAGLPKSFRESQGRVFRVTDYTGGTSRRRLYNELASRRYSVCGILCSGEPIMTKWKWVLAARLRSKLFLLNENGDYFWFDYSQWRTIRHFILFRAGLAGAGAVRTLTRLALFPLTLAYLLLYAAAVHIRRKMHA